MPIWDGATTVQLERSSAGQTATVPVAGEAVLATCDDAGTVTGAEIGELVTTDRKAREFAVTCGGATVAQLKLADRDRSLKQTVERWTLSVQSRPPAPTDLLAAAAILRYGKLFAEVSAPGSR